MLLYARLHPSLVLVQAAVRYLIAAVQFVVVTKKIRLKMLEVNVHSSYNDKLDQLLNNLQLVESETDSNGSNNNNSSVNAPQVPLFVTVRPPTEELLGDGTGLALDKGSNIERCMEGGLYQRTALSTQNTDTRILFQ